MRTYLIFWSFSFKKQLRTDDISRTVHDEINGTDSSFLCKATYVGADHCHRDRHCNGVNPHEKEACVPGSYRAGGIDKSTADNTIQLLAPFGFFNVEMESYYLITLHPTITKHRVLGTFDEMIPLKGIFSTARRHNPRKRTYDSNTKMKTTAPPGIPSNSVWKVEKPNPCKTNPLNWSLSV